MTPVENVVRWVHTELLGLTAIAISRGIPSRSRASIFRLLFTDSSHRKLLSPNCSQTECWLSSKLNVRRLGAAVSGLAIETIARPIPKWRNAFISCVIGSSLPDTHHIWHYCAHSNKLLLPWLTRHFVGALGRAMTPRIAWNIFPVWLEAKLGL